MPILVDGYNVIGRGRILGLSLGDDGKEKKLLDLLANYRDRKGARQAMTVIFDGSYASLARGRTAFSHRGISVCYAVGVSADQAIISRVARARSTRDLTVISSDQAVQRHCRQHGAAIMSAEDFLDMAASTLRQDVKEKPESPSKNEVEEWLKIFSKKSREDG